MHDHIDKIYFGAVTVIIPVYNRRALVMQAVDSVISQTFKNWELIIVDDGSDDGTREAVRAIKNHRIQLISLPHTGNIAALRNAGAAAGRGAWLCFLDSDDLWPENKLEIQLTGLERFPGKWCYGGFELFNEYPGDRKKNNKLFNAFSGCITEKILSAEAAVSIGSLMVSRKLFDEIGGFNTDPKLLFREDYDLALRLSLKAEAVAVPAALVFIREHTNRSTNQINDAHERMAETYLQFIRLAENSVPVKTAQRRRAHHLAEAAVDHFHQKRFGLAFNRIGAACIAGDRPRHLASSLKKMLFPAH